MWLCSNLLLSILLGLDDSDWFLQWLFYPEPRVLYIVRAQMKCLELHSFGRTLRVFHHSSPPRVTFLRGEWVLYPYQWALCSCKILGLKHQSSMRGRMRWVSNPFHALSHWWFEYHLYFSLVRYMKCRPFHWFHSIVYIPCHRIEAKMIRGPVRFGTGDTSRSYARIIHLVRGQAQEQNKEIE